MIHIKFFPALILPLLACGTGGSGEETDAGTDTDSTAAPSISTLIDLADHGLPLLLTAPDKQWTGGAEPVVTWKEETGRWELLAGDHFGLTISEEPGDIARLKADLDRDPLRKNTILNEDADQIIYRTEFPDDPDLAFIHFYKVVQAGDRAFTVQDIDGQTHNQQDIERMVVAISPKQPA